MLSGRALHQLLPGRPSAAGHRARREVRHPVGAVAAHGAQPAPGEAEARRAHRGRADGAEVLARAVLRDGARPRLPHRLRPARPDLAAPVRADGAQLHHATADDPAARATSSASRWARCCAPTRASSGSPWSAAEGCPTSSASRGSATSTRTSSAGSSRSWASPDCGELLDLPNDELMEAGNGTGEVRAWVAVAGAMRGHEMTAPGLRTDLRVDHRHGRRQLDALTRHGRRVR